MVTIRVIRPMRDTEGNEIVTVFVAKPMMVVYNADTSLHIGNFDTIGSIKEFFEFSGNRVEIDY